MSNESFISSFKEQQQRAYRINTEHGFEAPDAEYNIGEKIALIHAELSEALEGDRHGNPPSDHIPEFNALEEEFADAIIRMMNIAERKNLRLAEALLAKQIFNDNRPFKHGGKKY